MILSSESKYPAALGNCTRFTTRVSDRKSGEEVLA